MANPSVHLEYPKFQAFDPVTQQPLSGGFLHTYEVGTTTNKAAYTNYARTVQTTNPIILDSNGECDVYLNGKYRLVLKNSAGTQIWDIDNYNEAAEITGAGATGAAPETEGEITNGSFEYDEDTDNDPDAWTIVRYNNVDIVSSDSNHGKYSLKFTSPGGAPAVSGGGTATSDPVLTRGSTAHNLLFDLKASVADVTNYVDIKEYNAADALITTTRVYNDSTTNPTAWTSFISNLTTQATTRFVRIVLTGCDPSDPTAGNTMFDNVRWQVQDRGTLRIYSPTGTQGIDVIDSNENTSIYPNYVSVDNGTVEGVLFVDTADTSVTLTNLTGSTYDLTLDNSGGTGKIRLVTAGGVVEQYILDSSAAVGPVLRLVRDSASPAVNDVIGSIQWYAEDNASSSVLYGDIFVTMLDPAAPRDGQIHIRPVLAGASQQELVLYNGTLNGINALGAYKGYGTINSENGLYDQGNRVIRNGSNTLTSTLILTGAVTIAGAVNITGSNLTLTSSDLVKGSTNFTTPASVSGYASGHVVYLKNDIPNTSSPLAFTHGTLTSTFESVGKTGSGATNIWTALDSVPSTAKSILLKLATIPNGAVMTTYIRKNGDATAIGESTAVQVAPDTAGVTATIHQVWVPISSSVVFDIAASYGAATMALNLYLAGWSDSLV